MQPTEWRPVVGYEGIYAVSNYGAVRRVGLARGARPERILTPVVNRSGHLYVNLYRASEGKKFYVHRLVAIAFIGNGKALQEICHNDGNPQNNDIANLRWGTRGENMADAMKHGTLWSPKKTHCVHGHLFDEANTAFNAYGSKLCRACRRFNRTTYHVRCMETRAEFDRLTQEAIEAERAVKS